MSNFETAARPYARALFELASSEDKLQDWQDMLQIASVIAADQSMLAMFELPSMLAKDQVKLFLSVVTGVDKKIGSVADFKNLISVLAENHRLAALPAISVAFETLKQEAEGKIEVLVRSARALTVKQQDQISKSLAKRLGKEVSITSEVDESLIAGAIIRAGDLVIDGSARGGMDKLTTALNK